MFSYRRASAAALWFTARQCAGLGSRAGRQVAGPPRSAAQLVLPMAACCCVRCRADMMLHTMRAAESRSSAPCHSCVHLHRTLSQPADGTVLDLLTTLRKDNTGWVAAGLLGAHWVGSLLSSAGVHGKLREVRGIHAFLLNLLSCCSQICRNGSSNHKCTAGTT